MDVEAVAMGAAAGDEGDTSADFMELRFHLLFVHYQYQPELKLLTSSIQMLLIKWSSH